VFLLGPVAIKIFKKGLEKNAEKEWKFLNILKPYSIAPKPFFKFGRVVVMERIKGKPMREMSKEEIKKFAPEFLRALSILDKLGIQKEECHRPNKHFIMTSKGVKLIDFERAHFKKNPSNVTQFLSFLSNFYENALELAKKYKKERDIEKVILELR